MAVELRGLKKDYLGPDGSTVPVIDVPKLRLEDAEQVALVGGSGTGKTTLLHLISGILTADRGQILYQSGDSEVDLSTLCEADRDVFRGRYIGYIFQTHHLLPGLTALENVLLGMSFTGRPSEPKWAHELLEAVGLGDRLHYKPAKLSVGQQQRVAVARALANRPRLVLADEPTGALDVRNAQQVLALIRSLCSDTAATLVMVTHDPAVSAQFPRVLSLAELNRASI
jgi:putative ABC transport system ATP-binding protein